MGVLEPEPEPGPDPQAFGDDRVGHPDAEPGDLGEDAAGRSSLVARGTIKRLLPDRRFGFITAAGRDYYFHEDALQGAAFEELAEGADVLFEPAVDVRDEGPRAASVRLARDEG